MGFQFGGFPTHFGYPESSSAGPMDEQRATTGIVGGAGRSRKAYKYLYLPSLGARRLADSELAVNESLGARRLAAGDGDGRKRGEVLATTLCEPSQSACARSGTVRHAVSLNGTFFAVETPKWTHVGRFFRLGCQIGRK